LLTCWVGRFNQMKDELPAGERVDGSGNEEFVNPNDERPIDTDGRRSPPIIHIVRLIISDRNELNE
jgi:hypothetical protein